MNINIPTPDREYKLLVRCATYNQSKYICDALNGFAIQETDFPFICIVVDDASTDGNQEVIRRYANDNCDMSNAYVSDDDISIYMRVPHKTNTNCVYLFCFLKVNLYCKPEKTEIYKPYRAVCEYEAPCEGDDYWIDPLKLQKQVDFLEANQDYSMVHTAFQCVDENSQYLDIDSLVKEFRSSVDNPDNKKQKERVLNRLRAAKSYMDRSESGFVYYKLLATSNYIMTVTVLMRKSVADKIPQNGLYFDYGVFLVAARLGYVAYLSDFTSCYRFTPNSITSNPETLKKLGEKKRKLLLYEVGKLFKSDNLCIDDIYRFPQYKTMISRVLVSLLNKCCWVDKMRVLFFVFKHISLYVPFAYSLLFHPNLNDLYNCLQHRSRLSINV